MVNAETKIQKIKAAMQDYHNGCNIDGHEVDGLDTLIRIDNILKED